MIDIGKFELRKGDVVLLTCDQSGFTGEQLTWLETRMKEKLTAAGFDNLVIAIAGMKLEVVSQAA